MSGRRDIDTEQLDEWNRVLDHQGYVDLWPTRRGLVLQMAAPFLFVGGSMFVIAEADGDAVGVVAGLLGLFCAAVASLMSWSTWSGRKVPIRVDAEGLHHGVVNIAWEEIVEIVVHSSGKRGSTTLVLTDAAARRKADLDSAFERVVTRRVMRVFTGPSWALPPALPGSGDVLATWLADLHERYVPTT